MPPSPIPPAPKKAPPKGKASLPFDFPSRPERAPAPQPPATPVRPEHQLQFQEPSRKGPPLFIKIDKYQDVVNNLHRLKSYALSLRDALDALADIEKELQHGLSVTSRALDKFNTIIATLDAKITRVPPREADAPTPEAEEMDEYVREVNEQMEKIRQELKSISP